MRSTLTKKEIKSEQNMMKSLQKDKMFYFFHNFFS